MFVKKNNDKTYIVLSYQTLFIESLKKFANCKTAYYKFLQIKKSKVLESLKDFAQIIFKILLNNLNTYDQVEYLFNFINEKTSRIDCVYNISQDKFVAFRNYIANALKKIEFIF